jgi:hypothetical protein
MSPSNTVGTKTTCFGPTCGSSSGCDLTDSAAIQDVGGAFLGYWGLGGGNEISLFQQLVP